MVSPTWQRSPVPSSSSAYWMPDSSVMSFTLSLSPTSEPQPRRNTEASTARELIIRTFIAGIGQSQKEARPTGPKVRAWGFAFILFVNFQQLYLKRQFGVGRNYRR